MASPTTGNSPSNGSMPMVRFVPGIGIALSRTFASVEMRATESLVVGPLSLSVSKIGSMRVARIALQLLTSRNAAPMWAFPLRLQGARLLDAHHDAVRRAARVHH